MFNRVRLLVILFALPAFQSVGQVMQKPNIVLIMVDDLRPELGSYGKKHIVTPHMDRLAKTGQLFTRAYTNYPTCGPSRASLLSGLYPSRSRFNEWNCSQDKDVPGIVSMPMHFRNHNYKTISYGKVYNNLEDGKGSWDEIWRPVIASTEMIGWEYLSKDGIDTFEKLNRDRHANTKPRTSSNLPKKGFAFEGPDVPDDAYMDGKTADKTIEKLQELRQNTTQPFFLTVGFYKPHWPFNAPAKYWELYDREQIQLPSNSAPHKNAPEIMTVDRGGIRSHYGIPKSGPMPDSVAKALLHGFYASVSYVDSQIGKILNALDFFGMQDNTIVILWGDQGQEMGEHGIWDKNKNFSTSIQIPFIIKAPGKNKDIKINDLVESIDLYPTLCELSGLPKPFHVQGRSIVPLLNGTGPGKDAVFCRATPEGETIVTPTHTYTEFYDRHKKIVARALFDLREDPDENNNIAEAPASKAIVAELSKKLSEHIKDRDQISLLSVSQP
jgi:iduronate 2-sulfatase